MCVLHLKAIACNGKKNTSHIAAAATKTAIKKHKKKIFNFSFKANLLYIKMCSPFLLKEKIRYDKT